MPAPKGPFVGVTRNHRTWSARLYIDRVAHDVGPWPTAEEAAIARDRAILYFGVDNALVRPRASKKLGPASPDELVRLGRMRCRDLLRRQNTTGYTGVVAQNGGRSFVARLRTDAGDESLGYWSTAREAAIARDRRSYVRPPRAPREQDWRADTSVCGRTGARSSP